MRTEKIKLQGSLNGEKDPVLSLSDDHYLTPRGFRVPFWVVDTFGGNFEEQEPESLTMQEDTPVFSMSQVYEIFNQVSSHHKEIRSGDSIPDWLEKWGIRPKVAPQQRKALKAKGGTP